MPGRREVAWRATHRVSQHQPTRSATAAVGPCRYPWVSPTVTSAFMRVLGRGHGDPLRRCPRGLRPTTASRPARKPPGCGRRDRRVRAGAARSGRLVAGGAAAGRDGHMQGLVRPSASASSATTVYPPGLQPVRAAVCASRALPSGTHPEGAIAGLLAAHTGLTRLPWVPPQTGRRCAPRPAGCAMREREARGSPESVVREGDDERVERDGGALVLAVLSAVTLAGDPTISARTAPSARIP
jgi:hypothetical protein